MKTKTVAMVLVGGRGTRLLGITKKTAKPAVTFGGKYKLIDFVLSNLANAFIDTVGIVTQYEPHELMNYIQRGSSWDLDVSDGGIHFLTPYTSYTGDQWQKGTAHAVKQHFHFIDEYDPETVLILSGDHVYKMHYEQLIDSHVKSKADITIAGFYPEDDLSRYGILEVDKQNMLVGFEEKPVQPKSALASMGIYVFNKEILRTLLNENIHDVDFGRHVLPKALELGARIHVYSFKGYFRDVGTVEALYEANMDLIDHPEYLKLNDYKELPLMTRSKDLPPHHIASTHAVTDALISDGCLIMGTVKHSVLTSGVLIKENARVEDSLIYANVSVGEHAYLKRCIVLEDTVILPKTRLVFDEVTVIDNEYLWALGGKDDE